ncbi:glycoside hydrolase family 2 TIM barrel-domain containing protein, partial [Planctomycetota bacterium]
AMDGFYLNGKKIRIRGVNRNMFRPDTGRAIDPEEAWEDARVIKAMNANTVRCHLPPTTTFMEACDALGQKKSHSTASDGPLPER